MAISDAEYKKKYGQTRAQAAAARAKTRSSDAYKAKRASITASKAPKKSTLKASDMKAGWARKKKPKAPAKAATTSTAQKSRDLVNNFSKNNPTKKKDDGDAKVTPKAGGSGPAKKSSVAAKPASRSTASRKAYAEAASNKPTGKAKPPAKRATTSRKAYAEAAARGSSGKVKPPAKRANTSRAAYARSTGGK